MNIITSNPFRILGVYSNASKKDMSAAENKIKAHVKIGRDICFQSDLADFLGAINRTEESLATAVSRLTLAKDKVQYALFWFMHETAFDKMALGHLSSNNVDTAIQIWRKAQSPSSFVNLAVCSLVRREWANALYYYAKLIEDGVYNNFAKTIASEEVKYSTNEFVNVIISLLESNFSEVNWLFFTNAKNLYIAGEKVEIDDFLSNSILSKAIKKIYIDKIRDKISQAIGDAEKINRKNPSSCLSAAKKLSRISSEFKVLRSIIPSTDIRYTSLSDKVADVMDGLCKGYFNNSSDFRKARVIQPMVDAAYSFACSEAVKAQCQEGVDFIDSKVEELPPAAIESECQQIDTLLSDFVKRGNNESLLTCLTSCRDILNRIKVKVGESNAEYIKQSSMVVHFAINILVDEVNEKQKAYNDAPEFLDAFELTAYKKCLEWAKPIMELLNGFAKDPKCAERFKENNDTLISLYNRNCRPAPIRQPISRPITPRPITRPSVSTRPVTPRPVYTPSSSSSNNDDNSGCIIFGIIAAVVIFIIIIIANSGSSSSSSSSVYDSDTVAADTVVDDNYYGSNGYGSSYDSEPVQSQTDIWLETYKNNSLSTGATPYRSKYGGNSKSGSAGLKIKAPIGCDVLVMVKNAYGNVAKHAYIRSGQTYSFRLKAGTYQPFFVFGNSWCPEKEAPNGEMGYFLEDVSISKDYPQEIGEYQELEYTLQAVQGGNFHAASSSANEAF